MEVHLITKQLYKRLKTTSYSSLPKREKSEGVRLGAREGASLSDILHKTNTPNNDTITTPYPPTMNNINNNNNNNNNNASTFSLY